MTIKTVIEKPEDAPEALRQFYVKVEDDKSPINGKFLLNVEPTDGYTIDNVDSLKSALSAEREKNKGINSALEAFKGLDAKEVRTKLSKLEDLEKIDPEKEADRLASAKAATQIEQIKARSAEELEAATKRISTLEGRIETAFKGDRITAALVEHGATKGGMKVLPSVIASMTRLKEEGDGYTIEVLGDNGVPRIKDSVGTPLSLPEYVESLKKDPDYAVLFSGNESRSGTGTPPGQTTARSGGGKTMTRAEYEANPVAAAAKMAEGYRLAD